jgi:hypothetical protein
MYFMAFWCMFLMRILTIFFGMSILLSFSMKYSCMAPLTLATTMLRGLLSNPYFGVWLLVGHSCGVCLFVKFVMAIGEFYELECEMGRGLWLGAPITHRMSDLSLVGHWHDGWVQVHFSIRSRSVELDVVLLWYLALVK